MNFGPKFFQLFFNNNLYAIYLNIYLKLNNYLKNKVPGGDVAYSGGNLCPVYTR